MTWQQVVLFLGGGVVCTLLTGLVVFLVVAKKVSDNFWG